MNVVDSSAWIEYFTGGPNAEFFESPILNQAELIIPTMALLEVYKHIRRHQGRDEALKATQPFGIGVSLQRPLEGPRGASAVPNREGSLDGEMRVGALSARLA